LRSLESGEWVHYRKNWLSPALNWGLAKLLLGAPSADAVKVRMLELIGDDLENYPLDVGTINLAYEWSEELLSEHLGAEYPMPIPDLDRSLFSGEVLVISAREDVVFRPGTGREISKAYSNGKYCLVPGGHRLELSVKEHARLRSDFFRYGLRSREVEAGLSDLCLSLEPEDQPPRSLRTR